MFYDDFGRELETTSVRKEIGKTHEIADILDHGATPDFDKEDLIGEKIRVVGIVGPEDFPLGLVYFVLIQRATDVSEQEPWGIMFPAKSPVVTATLRAARQNMIPFHGVLLRTTSEANPDRQYWEWARK